MLNADVVMSAESKAFFFFKELCRKSGHFVYFAMFMYVLLQLQLANTYKSAETTNSCLLISLNVGMKSCVSVYPL